MSQTARVARDLTYAISAQTRGGRALIRTLENATGRLGLIRRAKGYENEVAAGADFWAVMARRYGLSLQITRGALDRIPATGPLIVISNHPFGILDGLMMGHILSARRGPNFRIVANSVFRKAAELEPVILPIRFDESRDGFETNLATRAAALDFLRGGGAIGIFPGGTVSTAKRPFGVPMDPAWRTFTAKLVARSGAVVVPVYFDGRNSRLFQLASHVHATLRLGLLIREFRRRIDQPVKAAIGAPIDAAEIAARARDPRLLMDYLRAETYRLADPPFESLDYGFDYDARYRH